MKASVLVAAFLAGLFVGIGLSGKAETWGVATLGSRHLDDRGYCEINPGGGVEFGDREWRTLIGAYRNSLRDDDGGCRTWSVYAGKSYQPLHLGRFRTGGALLAVTGYESALTLGAALVLSYERERSGFNIVIFPNKRGDLTSGVIAFQAKFRW